MNRFKIMKDRFELLEEIIEKEIELYGEVSTHLIELKKIYKKEFDDLIEFVRNGGEVNDN